MEKRLKKILNPLSAAPISTTAGRTADGYYLLIERYFDIYTTNLEFLLNYTGMSLRTYSKRLSGINLPTPWAILGKRKRRKNCGLDLIHFAGIAGVFGLNIDIVMNYDLELLYNRGEFCPENYGIFKGINRRKQLVVDLTERAITKPYHTSVAKKMKMAMNILRSEEIKERPNIFEIIRQNDV